jgi:hypothetical protein
LALWRSILLSLILRARFGALALNFIEPYLRARFGALALILLSLILGVHFVALGTQFY